MRPSAAGRLAVCAALCGCYAGVPGGGAGGTDSDAEGSGGSPTADETGTDGGDPPSVDDSEIGPSHMRQLSAWEYRNTIIDLFGDEIAEVESALATIPDAASEGGYSTMDRSMSAAHVDAHYTVAVAVAAAVNADPQRRAQLTPCLADAFDSACGEAFVDAFGPRAYRRPLEDNERDRLLEAFAADNVEDAVENALLYALMAPHFLYRPEFAGTGDDDVLRLTGYEVASRISYLLWGSMPDEGLFAMAAVDALDEEGIRSEAARLLASPRAAVAMGRFASEWLHMGQRPGLAASDAFLDGLDPTGLREDMMSEVDRLFEQLVFDDDASFADLMTTTVGSVQTESLAAIYGVAPDETNLGSERRGILTRAGMLLGGGEETHPIVRGSFIASQLLCNELSPPDPTTVPPGSLDPPPFDPSKTGRERWDEKTSPAACVACHAVLNPLGFVAEGYDAIGRTRTMEPIYDPDGEIVAELPVEARATVVLDGAMVDVADLAALGKILAGSETAQHCFATQWFRYAYGRHDATEDRAAIDAMQATVAADDPLLDVVVAFVTAEEFSHVRPAQ